MEQLPLTKKSLGQHWLTDAGALASIANAANITTTDTILEVGPGTGTLTQLLCERAQQVTAVEYDAALASDLTAKVADWKSNLTVVNQDILRFDLTQLPRGYKVVANIPYYLTSNLIRTLSESSNPPQTVVLLIQKEVAERVVAVPGDLSILGVTAQYYWQTSLGDLVPAKLFTPPPKVDSQVLVMQWRDQPLFGDLDTKAFFRIIKIGFSQKRKTILNTLSSGLHLSKAEVQAVCDRANVPATHRAQALSLDDWHRLYNALNA